MEETDKPILITTRFKIEYTTCLLAQAGIFSALAYNAGAIRAAITTALIGGMIVIATNSKEKDTPPSSIANQLHKEPQSVELSKTISKFATQAGLDPALKAYWFKSNTPRALANKLGGSLLVSDYIVKKFSLREQITAIGHEITHLAVNRRLNYLPHKFFRISNFVLIVGGKLGSPPIPFKEALPYLFLCAGGLATTLTVKAYLSRREEYLADRGAVLLSKDPNACITFLKKGDDLMRKGWSRGYKAFVAVFDLFAHPGISKRTRYMQKVARQNGMRLDHL